MKEYNLFYINLKHRVDRKNELKKEFEKLKNKNNTFKITRIDAIKNNKEGAIGVALSHIKALKLAKKLNLENIIIAEDDLFIKEELINKYFNIIENIKKWDVIILSGHCWSNYKLNSETKLDNYLSKCRSTQTATWYIVNKHYYDVLINCFLESHKNLSFCFIDDVSKEKRKSILKKWAIDKNWSKLQEKDNWYRFNINLGYQRPSYSDIEKEFVDYTSFFN